MQRTFITSLLLSASVLLTALPGAAHAQKVLSDQMLPRDTYLYLSFPNVARLKEQVGQSSLGQLWNDPEMADFKEELSRAFGDELQEGLQKVQEQLGFSVIELLNIPTGEVSLAVSAGPSNTMGAVFVLDFGDNESKILELLAKAQDALAEAPKLSQQSESFDGTEITLFRIQHDGPAPTPLAKEFGWFVKDQRLVVCNRLELMQAILSNWAGEQESFMDNETYAYILSKCQTGDRTATSTFYIDPIGMFTKLVQTGSLGQQATMGAGMALGFIPTLGLNQLKGIGACSESLTGEFENVTRSLVYAEQPPQGLMRIFQLEQIDHTPPAWVKENVHAYVAMKWNVAEAFNAVRDLVDMFSGQGAFDDRLNQMADRGPKIHLQHDVFDRLTGEIRLITGSSGQSDQPLASEVVVAIGINDENAVKDVLAKIADEAGLDTRDFRGTTIFEFNGAQAGQSIGVTVSEGRVLLGVGGGLLDAVLRNDPDVKPLAESEDYRKIAQYFPSDAVTVQFSRPLEQYRSLYESVQSGEAAEKFPGSQEIFDRIDFTKLPPFEVISKYIRPTGGFSAKDPKGLFSQAFQLKQ